MNSSHFEGPSDLELLARIASTTETMPADLNWVRLEEWRVATASMFDSSGMRERLGDLRTVRIHSACSEAPTFGERIDAVLFGAWVSTALGREITVGFETADRRGKGCMVAASLEFAAGGRVVIEQIEAHRVIVARAEGIDEAWPTVTRYAEEDTVELVSRQLSRRDEDPMFPRVLPAAAVLARSL